MEVLKVLDWFKSLNKVDRPVTVEVKGHAYEVNVDGTLGDVVRPVLPVAPVAPPELQLSTLTGFVDAYKARLDGFASFAGVQVNGFDEVTLVSLQADEWGRRHVWMRAKSTEVNPFQFGTYIDPETFIIKAQAGFVPVDGHYSNMLRLCSSLTAASSVTVADDGFSQKIAVHQGGVAHGAVELPPRLTLRPYRTFREIDPVDSDFLLRFKARKDALPEVALLPVDAGRWKTDTAMAVAGWLRAALPKGAVVIA